MAFSFSDQNVIVTGGASGLGKIMVKKILDRGAANVVIWDINMEGMEAVKATYSPYADKIHLVKADINNAENIAEAANITTSLVTNVHCIINNAGIVTGKLFHEHTATEIARSMQINSLAPMQIVSAFLPQMMKQKQAAICNISSMASLIGNPRMSVYAASKWAVSGWSESLRIEMKQLQKNVSITTIMPFYISTGMFDGVRSPILPILQPDDVCEKIIRGIEKQKPIVCMPLPYWLVRLCQGILPIAAFDWVMEHIFGIYHSMDQFKGRKA